MSQPHTIISPGTFAGTARQMGHSGFIKSRKKLRCNSMAEQR